MLACSRQVTLQLPVSDQIPAQDGGGWRRCSVCAVAAGSKGAGWPRYTLPPVSQHRKWAKMLPFWAEARAATTAVPAAADSAGAAAAAAELDEAPSVAEADAHIKLRAATCAAWAPAAPLLIVGTRAGLLLLWQATLKEGRLALDLGAHARVGGGSIAAVAWAGAPVPLSGSSKSQLVVRARSGVS